MASGLQTEDYTGCRSGPMYVQPSLSLQQPCEAGEALGG